MPRYRVQLLLLAVCICLPATGAAQAAESAPGPAHSDMLPMAQVVTLDEGVASVWWGQTKQRLQMVIRDQASWSTLWRHVTASRSGSSNPPSVDFSRDMLLVASDGAIRDWERISIAEVDPGMDTLVVHVRVQIYVAQRCNESAMFRPVAIVRVPRDPRPARFVERVIDEGCSPS